MAMNSQMERRTTEGLRETLKEYEKELESLRVRTEKYERGYGMEAAVRIRGFMLANRVPSHNIIDHRFRSKCIFKTC